MKRAATSSRRSRAKPPDPADISWGAVSVFTGILDRGGHRFATMIHPAAGRWHLFGLVTRSPELGQTGEQATEAVLAHHAHQSLGAFAELDGESGAMASARKFLLEAPPPTEACSCDEVGYTPKGPDP